MQRRFLLPAALAALALVASGRSTAAAPKAGGTYRVGWESSFGFSDNFDPTGEYYNLSFAILSSLVVRTLVGYDHVGGPAGNKLVPDIATTVPAPTDGGKTYTFHLKHVKFGPPVDRAVTSKDVATRSSGSPRQRTAASTRSTSRPSRAGTATPQARRRPSRASRRRTTRPSSSTSPGRPATSSTGSRCRRRARSRARLSGASTGNPAATAATSSPLGPT